MSKMGLKWLSFVQANRNLQANKSAENGIEHISFHT